MAMHQNDLLALDILCDKLLELCQDESAREIVNQFRSEIVEKFPIDNDLCAIMYDCAKIAQATSKLTPKENDFRELTSTAINKNPQLTKVLQGMINADYQNIQRIDTATSGGNSITLSGVWLPALDTTQWILKDTTGNQVSWSVSDLQVLQSCKYISADQIKANNVNSKNTP